MKREVEGGDAFFPPFEDKFELAEEIRDDAGIQDSALPAQVAVEMIREGWRAAVILEFLTCDMSMTPTTSDASEIKTGGLLPVRLFAN